MRIAWIGGGVGKDGGVGTLGLHILEGLLQSGVFVEIFTIGDNGRVPAELQEHKTLKIIEIPQSWSWNRWYCRHRLLAFATNLGTRTLGYRRMINLLRVRHAQEPYDIIFQMSQTELFNLKKYLAKLPPVVVFPCVHAAGELRWHRLEGRYARQVENPIFHYSVRLFLKFRSFVQKRELRKPAMVIGMSHRFNELLREDYGVDGNRQAVVYNAIQSPGPGSRRISEAKDSGRPLRLLFVARISVRKGVEQVVELSKRLDDLAGKVELHIIGGATMWSDYRRHLKDLNPRIAKYLGGLPHADIMSVMDQSDALVLPSHYEPGGIVVGEALSRGLPVVVNQEIGSAEPVEGPCRRMFKAGDMDGFEREVRRLLADLLVDPAALRISAREQAEKHFAPSKIARDFLTVLESVLARHRQEQADQKLLPALA